MRIILVGFGTVGQSFIQVLYQKRAELLRLYGLRPRVIAILDSKGALVNPNGVDCEQAISVKQKRGSVGYDPDFGKPQYRALDAINDLPADVVVEVSPTNLLNGQPGLSHIELALRKQCHVITANKGPLAIAFPALLELAQYNNVQFRFSGTVGGGTPILDLGKNGLQGDRVTSIRGILNGTTNYILTRMTTARISMDAALQEAQAAGYAEADPTNDVEGFDSASKLVILANWVMNSALTLNDVQIEGISQVSLKDIDNARKKQCVVKLIASYDQERGTVTPQMLAMTHPLNVAGVLNAVTYQTEYAGEITLTGHGAGGTETASAVLRDLIDIRRNISI